MHIASGKQNEKTQVPNNCSVPEFFSWKFCLPTVWALLQQT